MSSPERAHEQQRLDALHRYQMLDTLPDIELDRITRFVKHLLKVPVVVVSLVEAKHIWLKSAQGTTLRTTERGNMCCGEAIKHSGVFAVPDLHADPWFQHDPMVKLEGARAYAGAPLTTPDGFRIGVLGVYDQRPRFFSPEEQGFLLDLAAVVIDELELRLMMLNWQHAQQHSEYLAHHDALTGLPNRLRLLDRAELALHHADRSGRPVGVMVLDLDGFKTINDSLGHLVGDALLRAVGERLCGAVRAEDSIARFGGDEFVILLPELQAPLDAAQVAHKLLRALDLPFQIGEHALEVKCSIGISLYPDDGQSAETLLRTADTAMYQAKAAGKARSCFYNEEMTVEAQAKLHLRKMLARAVQQGELGLHYQPQVDLQTGEVVGLEALLRWPQLDGTWIAPLHFIPLAEESGLIVEIGQSVLRGACEQLARWRGQGCPDWTMSVNVSVRQWEDPDFLGSVKRVLEATNLPAACLVLEVTESVMLTRPREALRLAETLTALGVQVSLDDFGTGYSSLSQLQHLSIRQLKVDRSFVQGLPDQARGLAVTETIILLGHRLDARVVGEGIETEAQCETLRGLGCDVGQGFLFARPMSPQEVEGRYLPRISTSSA